LPKVLKLLKLSRKSVQNYTRIQATGQSTGGANSLSLSLSLSLGISSLTQSWQQIMPLLAKNNSMMLPHFQLNKFYQNAPILQIRPKPNLL
jgi:hypothetical protein